MSLEINGLDISKDFIFPASLEGLSFRIKKVLYRYFKGDKSVTNGRSFFWFPADLDNLTKFEVRELLRHLILSGQLNVTRFKNFGRKSRIELLEWLEVSSEDYNLAWGHSSCEVRRLRREMENLKWENKILKSRARK